MRTRQRRPKVRQEPGGIFPTIIPEQQRFSLLLVLILLLLIVLLIAI